MISEEEICCFYRDGKFMKEISKEFNISVRFIKKTLIKNKIEILNYAKRITPKNAFKKNSKPHNYMKTLEESYGNRALEIRKKISDARIGKKYIEILGSEEAILQCKNRSNETRIINREKISKSHSIETSKRWKIGVYDLIANKFYRVKWYNYKKIDNSIVKLQGTWEVELAKRLDFLNIKWICHSEITNRFVYFDKDNIEHSYKPDFQIVDTNIYIDPHWDFSDKHVRKFDYVKNNYDIDLILLKNINEVKEFTMEEDKCQCSVPNKSRALL